MTAIDQYKFFLNAVEASKESVMAAFALLLFDVLLAASRKFIGVNFTHRFGIISQLKSIIISIKSALLGN